MSNSKLVELQSYTGTEQKEDGQDKDDANLQTTLKKQKAILAKALAGENMESITENFIKQDEDEEEQKTLEDEVIRIKPNTQKPGLFDVEFNLFGRSSISREGEISIIIVYLIISVSQFALFIYAVLITYFLNQWSKDESIQSPFIVKFGSYDLNVLQLVKWIRFSAWAVKAEFAMFNVLRSYKREDTGITKYVATLVGFIIPVPLIDHMVTDSTVPKSYYDEEQSEEEEKQHEINDLRTLQQISKLKYSMSHIHQLIIRNRFKLQSQVFTTFFDFYCSIFILPIAVMRSQGIKVEGIKELQKDDEMLKLFMAASICLVVNWIASDISSSVHEVKGMLEYTFNIKTIEKQIKQKYGICEDKDSLSGVVGDGSIFDEDMDLMELENQKPSEIFKQMKKIKKKQKENGFFALYNKNIRPHVIHFEQYQKITWANKIFLYGYAILLFLFDIFTITVSLCPGTKMEKFLAEICTFFSIVSPASIRLSLLATWGTRFLVTFCWVIYRYKSLNVTKNDKQNEEKEYNDSISHLCKSIGQNGIFWTMRQDKQLCKTIMEIEDLNLKKNEIGDEFESKIKNLSHVGNIDLFARDSIKQWDDIHGRQLTQSPVFLWCLLSIPTPQSIYLFVNDREFELPIRRYSWPKIYIFMRLYCQLYIFYLILASAAFVKIAKEDYKDQLKLDPPNPIKIFFILLTVVGIAMQLGIQANYFNQERKRMEQATTNKQKGKVNERGMKEE